MEPQRLRRRPRTEEIADLEAAGHRLLAVVPLFLLSAACGGPDDRASCDCNLLLRIDGEVYSGAGLMTAGAHPVRSADRSSCSDRGDDPRGVYFATDPERGGVWAFDGQDPRRVVGVRE